MAIERATDVYAESNPMRGGSNRRQVHEWIERPGGVIADEERIQAELFGQLSRGTFFRAYSWHSTNCWMTGHTSSSSKMFTGLVRPASSCCSTSLGPRLQERSC